MDEEPNWMWRRESFWNEWFVEKEDLQPHTYRFLCCGYITEVSWASRGSTMRNHTLHLGRCPNYGEWCDEKYPYMTRLTDD